MENVENYTHLHTSMYMIYWKWRIKRSVVKKYFPFLSWFFIHDLLYVQMVYSIYCIIWGSQILKISIAQFLYSVFDVYKWKYDHQILNISSRDVSEKMRFRIFYYWEWWKSKNMDRDINSKASTLVSQSAWKYIDVFCK